MSDVTGKLLCWIALAAALLPHALPGQEGGTSTRTGATGTTGAATDGGAPSQMELLDDEWRLKTGDRLVYEVKEEREEPVLLTVNARGELLVPLVGSVPAAGKTSKELAYELKSELEEEFFHRATVMVTQREEDRNRGRVTVIGEVRRQGEQLIPVDAPLTVSQAILQSGGFTLAADDAKVSVVSQGEDEARVEVDVGRMMDRADFSNDPILRSGDVVIVPRSNQAETQVYVLGAVRQPGLLAIRDDEISISQAILKAGGFTRFARRNKVRLVTKDERGEKTEMEIDVGKILEGGDRSEDRVLKPGDMIIVEEKMISFTG